MTGTLTRNTEPHHRCSSSTPATTGPAAAPPENAADQTATAVARRRGSGNAVLISENVEGMSVAPPRPSRARAAIRAPEVGANAASTEATPNAAAPHISSRRRPMRSPSVPMVTSSPASTNE
jgi:hypothetical protein